MSRASRGPHTRWLAALLAPAVLLGASLSASAASADPTDDIPVNVNDPAPYGCTSASSGRYTTCTNDPYSSDPAEQEPLVDVFIDLTESADTGDTITIAMFSWWYRKAGDPFDYSAMHTFTHDLIDAAEDRGVSVSIALDEHSDPSLNTDLDSTIDQPCDELTSSPAINFVACGESSVADSRCLEDPTKTSAIQHNKLLLFDIGGVKHVAVSSANFGAAGMAQLTRTPSRSPGTPRCTTSTGPTGPGWWRTTGTARRRPAAGSTRAA